MWPTAGCISTASAALGFHLLANRFHRLAGRLHLAGERLHRRLPPFEAPGLLVHHPGLLVYLATERILPVPELLAVPKR